MNSYTEKSALLERHHRRLAALINHPTYTTAYHPSHLGRLLNLAAHNLSEWLTNGSMPRVSKAHQSGKEVWKVYDPMANRTRYFEQEEALRVWMEERYYQ